MPAANPMEWSLGKEFQATTDGPKNTDVHLFVSDSSGAEVAKDDSPGPKCSVKVTLAMDGQYKFVITNAGEAKTVTFNVEVANDDSRHVKKDTRIRAKWLSEKRGTIVITAIPKPRISSYHWLREAGQVRSVSRAWAGTPSGTAIARCSMSAVRR